MDVASNLVVAIMAGGSGTRFWPMSREERPKQFLNLTGSRTMLQVTRDRLEGLVPPERILVLTNARFADLAREQLPELPSENVIGEPMARDTSGAVALAAALVEKKWPGAVLAILAADHTIETAARFQEVLLGTAEAATAEGGLYTFGIQPRNAATGYGYLEVGTKIGERRGAAVHKLAAFREKPDAATAESFLKSGKHLWNSGMFVWKTTDILAEIEKHLPAHHAAMKGAAAAWGTDKFDEASQGGFRTAPQGVHRFRRDGKGRRRALRRRRLRLERRGRLGGSGASPSAGRGGQLDPDRPSALGRHREHRGVGAERPQGGCIGVSDLIVVTTPNATLVCRKGDAERIKQAVEALKKA
jgi:mannose-1-phosphate guanylyltransferase